MDYKYIEQLLERYWQCETSTQEEQILQVFFSQKNIPENLRPYQSLFIYEQVLGKEKLSADFDAKVFEKIKTPIVKARSLTLVGRFMPMMKAAAMVAMVFTLGSVAQQTFFADDNALDYNYATYKDTYSDPQMAYEQVSSALQKVSMGMNKSHKLMVDSLHQSSGSSINNSKD
jgi:hypothetical protein